MLVSNFFFRVIYVEYMSFGSSQIVAPKKWKTIIINKFESLKAVQFFNVLGFFIQITLTRALYDLAPNE